MKSGLKFSKDSHAGFSLFELVIVLIIIGIIIGVMTFPLLRIVDAMRVRAERQIMATLKEEIRASFRQEDMTTNISAIRYEMNETGSITYALFDWHRPPRNEPYQPDSWYSRLAIMRGQTMTGGLLVNHEGPIKDIAYNAFRARRVLLVGPIEDDRQRYLLVSFLFNDDTIDLPPAPGGALAETYGDPDYARWFNRMYENNWDDGGSPPSGDADPTTNGGWDPAFYAAWNSRAPGSHNKTYAQRVIVERIVQPRYRVAVNNLTVETTSALGVVETPDTIYLQSNFVMYNTMPAIEKLVGPGLGVGGNTQILPEPIGGGRGILEGRRVLIKRGKTLASATDVLSFLINENTTYTAQ